MGWSGSSAMKRSAKSLSPRSLASRTKAESYLHAFKGPGGCPTRVVHALHGRASGHRLQRITPRVLGDIARGVHPTYPAVSRYHPLFAHTLRGLAMCCEK